MWAFNTIWHFIASTASIGVIVGGCATAVAVLLPKQLDFITDLRKWAVVVAVIAFSYTLVMGKGYSDGVAVKQAEWDAALAKEVADGNKARADAVRTVPPVSADRGVLRSDPRNRDARHK